MQPRPRSPVPAAPARPGDAAGGGNAAWGREMGQGVLGKSPIPEQLPWLLRKPSQFITPYRRCPRECALKSLNELDSADQNSPISHINCQVSPLGHTGENWGMWPEARGRIRPQLLSCKGA